MDKLLEGERFTANSLSELRSEAAATGLRDRCGQWPDRELPVHNGSVGAVSFRASNRPNMKGPPISIRSHEYSAMIALPFRL